MAKKKPHHNLSPEFESPVLVLAASHETFSRFYPRLDGPELSPKLIFEIRKQPRGKIETSRSLPSSPVNKRLNATDPLLDVEESIGPFVPHHDQSSLIETRNKALYTLLICRNTITTLEVDCLRRPQTGLTCWAFFWLQIYNSYWARMIITQACNVHPKIDGLFSTAAKPSVGDPLYGSYHVLFPLTFDTSLCWLTKIPINGTKSKWDELSASSLTSEVNAHLGGIDAAYQMPQPYDSKKPTLVLVNSFTIDSDLYQKQYANSQLTDTMNLLAIELLGHGQTRTARENWTYWDTAEMNLQVLDQLGIDKVFVLGTSQGGWITVRMALLRPEKVSNKQIPSIMYRIWDKHCIRLRGSFPWAHLLISNPSAPAS